MGDGRRMRKKGGRNNETKKQNLKKKKSLDKGIWGVRKRKRNEEII